jgi:hypothetical protein
LNINLPRWFSRIEGKKRIIIVEVHFIPNMESEECNLKAVIMNKGMNNISVHSKDLALMSSEYNNSGSAIDATFMRYTNNRIFKVVEINHNKPLSDDNISFELYDLNQDKIPQNKMKLLRIELILNIIPD